MRRSKNNFLLVRPPTLLPQIKIIRLPKSILAVVGHGPFVSLCCDMGGFCCPGLNYHYFILLAFIMEIVIGIFVKQFDPLIFVGLTTFKAKRAVITGKGSTLLTQESG